MLGSRATTLARDPATLSSVSHAQERRPRYGCSWQTGVAAEAARTRGRSQHCTARTVAGRPCLGQGAKDAGEYQGRIPAKVISACLDAHND